MIVSKYRENDSFFYIGLGVLALYTIFAYKMVESMEDSDQENDEDQSWLSRSFSVLSFNTK